MMKKQGNLLKAVQNRRGVSAVIVAICLVMLIGFAALAIDVGYLYSTRNELQNVADAAALAGAGYLGSEYGKLTYSEQLVKTFTRTEVVNKVNEVAQKNYAAGVSILIRDVEADGDIIIGNLDWDHDPPTVNPTLTAPDAVQVIARRDNLANQPIATFFAPVFRILDPSYDPRKNVTAIATAALTGSEEVEPGELKVPFSISELVMDHCTDLITFSPTLTSCAGWHNFGDLVNASGVADNLLGIIQEHTCGDGGCGISTAGYTLLDGADWLAANFDLIKTPVPVVTGAGNDPPGFYAGMEIDHSGGTISSLFNGAILDPSTDGGNNPDNYGTYTDPQANSKNPAQFQALFDYFRYRDGDTNFTDPNNNHFYPKDQVWTATIPVYEEIGGCANPGGDQKIKYFVTIKVLMPNPPPDSTVSVYIDCNQSFTPGRGGGGTGPLKGTIPNLVR